MEVVHHNMENEESELSYFCPKSGVQHSATQVHDVVHVDLSLVPTQTLASDTLKF